MAATTYTDDASYNLARVFAERNDDRVHVFANGHVYGRADRRASARALIAMARRQRARELTRA